jgi:hypothetical protein
MKWPSADEIAQRLETPSPAEFHRGAESISYRKT